MPVNLDKPQRWKNDATRSIDMYNRWFMRYAPKAYRQERGKAIEAVTSALELTSNFQHIRPEILRRHPEILPVLRQSTCPPLAVDRLAGLAGVSRSLLQRMEKMGKLPANLTRTELNSELRKIAVLVRKMMDPDIFTWISEGGSASKVRIHRAASIVADRLCGALSNPVIRNAQEHRQLAALDSWLRKRGYTRIPKSEKHITIHTMPAGTYKFHMNISVQPANADRQLNVPVDVAIMRSSAVSTDFPLLIEAKSAGDFANTNKRRKEEAQKNRQIRAFYGQKIQLVLFLGGYFDSGYLGYEAAEGIDWVWEHRKDDLLEFGL